MIHRLLTSDTLAGLAARFYGDPTRWREIVTANELRPPYISSDPLDQYGAALASYLSPLPIAAGQLTIAIAGDARILRPAARVIFMRQTTSGAQLMDVCLVANFAAGVLTLQTPPTNYYPAGTALRIYAPAGALRGMVAKPGDSIIIPGIGNQTANTSTADDRYGRDLRCDAQGRLLLTDAGDLDLLDGVANLAQQLRNRLLCERGAMVRHPAYGCDAPAYVGQTTGPTLAALLQGAVASALTDDPRVASVSGITVSTELDSIVVAARVQAQGDSVDISIAVGS